MKNDQPTIFNISIYIISLNRELNTLPHEFDIFLILNKVTCGLYSSNEISYF